MTYTESDICAAYRSAKDKPDQIQKLVDLAQLPSSEIVHILRDNGYSVDFEVSETNPAPLPRKKSKSFMWTLDTEQQLCKLFEEGLAELDIADRLGVSLQSVKYKLTRMGLKKKAPPRAATPESAMVKDTDPVNHLYDSLKPKKKQEQTEILSAVQLVDQAGEDLFGNRLLQCAFALGQLRRLLDAMAVGPPCGKGGEPV